MIASRAGQGVTVYGDGKQVRDILFIDDLLEAYDCAFSAGERAYGKAFNIGGGPENKISIRDLLAFIEQCQGHPVTYTTADWRPGDQKIFVSDIRRAKQELGWFPRTPYLQGLHLLYKWVCDNESLFTPELQLQGPSLSDNLLPFTATAGAVS